MAKPDVPPIIFQAPSAAQRSRHLAWLHKVDDRTFAATKMHRMPGTSWYEDPPCFAKGDSMDPAMLIGICKHIVEKLRVGSAPTGEFLMGQRLAATPIDLPQALDDATERCNKGAKQ